MKNIIGVLSAIIISLAIGATNASASEGAIKLSNSDVACEGVSIWRESSYHVVGRCQGLVYPYSEQVDHYVLWARMENGNTVRIDDVDRGYFEGMITNAFADVIVTAESSSSPRRPSSTQILAGEVIPFEFDTSETTAPAPTATPAPQTGGMTVQNGAAATTSGVTVGSVVGRILRALLVIVGIIILIAVAASLIFRRRGSVSA